MCFPNDFCTSGFWTTGWAGLQLSGTFAVLIMTNLWTSASPTQSPACMIHPLAISHPTRTSPAFKNLISLTTSIMTSPITRTIVHDRSRTGAIMDYGSVAPGFVLAHSSPSCCSGSRTSDRNSKSTIPKEIQDFWSLQFRSFKFWDFDFLRFFWEFEFSGLGYLGIIFRDFEFRSMYATLFWGLLAGIYDRR